MSMDGVLRLYFGESNLPTPRVHRRRRRRARSADGHTFYSENAGLPSLRRAIAGQYRAAARRRARPRHARSSSPPPASRRCTWRSARSSIPGDEAIILSPAWPNGASIVALSHGRPVDVPLVARRRALPDRLRRARGGADPRTRLILLTSPSNPLGWVADVDEQQPAARALPRARHLARSPTRSTSGSTTPARRSASRRRRSCGSATRDDPVHVVQSFSKTLLHDRLARRLARHARRPRAASSPS